MGNKRNRRNKGRNIGPLSCQPTPEPSFPKLPDDRTKPMKKPQMIPLNTFDIISDYMLQLPASHRNVFLSVKEYPMNGINPFYVKTKNSPTHVLVFCMRLITTDYFAPIGLVQVNMREDQADKLVTVWKAFIQDLSILRLIVIGSISPATPIFHDVLSKLTENPDLHKHTDPVTYSVWPYKEILHLYDIPSIMAELQDNLYELVNLYFITRPASGQMSDATPTNDMRMYDACWTDILLALASTNTRCFYTTGEETLDVSIYSAEFQQIYNSYSKLGIQATLTKPSTDRLLQILWEFMESTTTKTDLTPDDIQDFYDKNENLRIFLASARFRWFFDDYLQRDLAVQPVPEAVPNPEDGTVSLSSPHSIEISDNQISNIITIIDNSLNNHKEPFDSFMKKFVYNHDILFNRKPTAVIHPSVQAAAEQNKSLRAEFDLTHINSHQKKETVKQKESRISTLVKEYFEGLKIKNQKNLQEHSKIDARDSKDGLNKTIMDVKTDDSFIHNSAVKRKRSRTFSKKIDSPSASTMLIPDQTPKMPELSCEHCVNGPFDLHVSNESNITTAKSVQSNEKLTFQDGRAVESTKDENQLSFKKRKESPTSNEYCYQQDRFESNESTVSLLNGLDNINKISGNVLSNTKPDTDTKIPKTEETNMNKLDTKHLEKTNSNLRKEEVSDYENVYSRILDGLDLAGSGKGTFDTSVSSVMDSGLTAFSNIFPSCTKSIVDKPIRSTDSVDSLAELVSTFDGDDALAKLPSKYNVLKKIGPYHKKLSNDKISNTANAEHSKKQFDALNRLKTHLRHLNSELLTNDDSHYMFNLLRLKNNYGISQKPNYFLSGKSKEKTPIEELKTLMNEVNNCDKDNTVVCNKNNIQQSEEVLTEKIDQLSDSIYDIRCALPPASDTLEAKSTGQESEKLHENVDSDEQQILEYGQLGTILGKLAKYTAEMKKDIKSDPPKILNSVSKSPETSSIKDAKESEKIEYDLLMTLTGIYIDQIGKESRSKSQSINKENNPGQYTNIKQNDKSKTTDQITHKKESTSKENISKSFIQPVNKSLKNYEAAKTKSKNMEHRTSFEDNLRGFFNSDKVKNTVESVNKNENCCMKNKVAQTKSNHTEPRTSFEDNLRGSFNSNKSKNTAQSLNKRENNSTKDKATKTKSEFDSNNVAEPMNKKESLDKKLKDSLVNKNSSNYLKPNVKTVESKILPCCSVPSSSSDFHFPTLNIKERVILPHYTRFDSFGSDSGDVSPASIVTTSHVPDANEIITQPIENDNIQHIDYQTYRKNLEASLCDKKKPDCDTIFKDRDCLNKILSSIPIKESLEMRCTTDWLCTFKGYLKLKDILVRRQVRSIKPNLFCVEHINYYVALMMKLKNKMLSTDYEGPCYRFVDYKCAFDLLNCGVGVYMLTQDGVDYGDNNIKN